MNNPNLISLTGADDKVNTKDLYNLTLAYPEVEWAILYFPEKEGVNRNPTAAWREQFLSRRITHSAAHLCGTQVFQDILSNDRSSARIDDIARYGRVQLNINARREDFNRDQVLTVYERLKDAGITLILQYHEGSKALIDMYLKSLTTDELKRTNILFDGSKGKGKLPESWASPLVVNGQMLYCGYAGGLGPDVVESELDKIKHAVSDAPYWIDMESGIRTDNEFDLVKCKKVLDLSTYVNSTVLTM